jgi:hypothetical protein
MATHDRAGNAYGSPARAKTNAERETHGEEGLIRTQLHPMMGQGPRNMVGRYKGSAGGQHFFSAEGTEGGSTDSHVIVDTADFKWHGEKGERYAYNTELGHSGTITPYSKSHYGLPGAPMSDTPAKYHDRNYRNK